MTEDITHGLALLADEAEPAPIDSHAVIATARARTRNRRAMATVVASVAAIGALTLTLSTYQAVDTATPGESPSQRLTAQLAAAVPDVIPSRWQTASAPPPDPTNATPPPPLLFGCNSEAPPPPLADSQVSEAPPLMETTDEYIARHVGPGPDWDWCGAKAWYQDAEGRIDFRLEVKNSGRWSFEPCRASECDEWALPDGTRVRVHVATVGVSSVGYLQQLEALRPDGTNVHVLLNWQDDRSEPPLTLDELVKFANKFDY